MTNINNPAAYADPVYPGTPLRTGSSGASVALMQQHLNSLANLYTGINKLTVDGRFGANTKNAVIRFQKQFSLNPDGVIGRLTWNSILAVDNALMSGNATDVTTRYNGLLTTNSRGDQVRFLQSYLNKIREKNNYMWPTLTVDGIYGRNTALAVSGFQTVSGIAVDGKVGQNTWNKVVPAFNSVT